MPTITPTLTPVALAAAASPDPILMLILTAVIGIVGGVIVTWGWGLVSRNWQHGDRAIESAKELADDKYEHLRELLQRAEKKIEDACDDIANVRQIIGDAQIAILKVELGLERVDGAVQMQLEIERLRGLVSHTPERGTAA